MAYTELSISTDWPTAAQFTANGSTACMLAAPRNKDLFFAISDTRPSVNPRKFHLLLGGNSSAFVLETGESLWIASPATDDDFTAILTTGPAV